MRHWLLHPLIFYPLAALLAALVIATSLKPQAWPREPAPVAAAREGQWLVFQGEGFKSPAVDEYQEMTVVRDFWGRGQALRLASRGRSAPGPQEEGARILLDADDAAALSGRPLVVEVSYNPSPVNAATGLAVRVGGGPWISQSAPPQPATLRFSLPPQNEVNAIALRAVAPSDDQAYGLEITRIRVMPHA
ncbi:MAG: hypothetical protein ACT4OF_09255 [Caulobacteraceae bacterium]